MSEVKNILISLIRSVETAIEAADWEPGDAQRALRELRDKYNKLESRATGLLIERYENTDLR